MIKKSLKHLSPTSHMHSTNSGFRSLQLMTAVGLVAFLAQAFATRSLWAIDTFPTEADLKRLGLEVQWKGAVEGSLSSSQATRLRLWQHSDRRKQIITIRVGDRIVEQIDANQILTFTGFEEPNPSGNASIGVVDANGMVRLGLEAAKAQASEIVKHYAAIGRKATIEEVVDHPMVYLVACSSVGGVQALNAETGEQLWSTAVGSPRYPTMGPGVNDDVVAVANGNQLYVIDLETGRLVGSRRMVETAAGPPMPVGPLIYVPSAGGTIAGYESTAVKTEPVTMRFTGALSDEVIPSIDGSYISWLEKNSLYIAQAGRRFTQWSKVEAGSLLRSTPQPTGDGFVTASVSGMVYRVNLHRQNSIVWRQNLAKQLIKPLFVTSSLVLAVSDSGSCTAMQIATGEIAWRSSAFDIDHIVAASENRIYAQTVSSHLIAIDVMTGETVGMTSQPVAPAFVNSLNNRVILAAKSGTIVSLREIDSPTPKVHFERKLDAAITDKPAKDSAAMTSPAVEAPTETMSASDTSDPFATPAVPGASPAMNEDPFGSFPTTPANSTDPFAVP